MNLDDIDEDIRNRYKNLVLEDEEDDTIQVLVVVESKDHFYYVGVLHTVGDVNEPAFRRTISKLWRPKGGVNIKWIGPHYRFLFIFFLHCDYERVWEGSAWNFKNKLLALAPRKPDEDPVKLIVN